MDLTAQMAKIHAGITELKSAHVRLFEASKKNAGAPRNLLLFYAAECGLKCACLLRNKLRTTEQLETVDHNLIGLIKGLKLRAPAGGSPPELRLYRRNPPTCPHSDAHQAWRYGVRLENAGELRFVEWLQNICEVLMKEHL